MSHNEWGWRHRDHDWRGHRHRDHDWRRHDRWDDWDHDDDC